MNGNKDTLDPTGLIEAADDEIIYVALKYRIGAFGFSSGPTLEADGGMPMQDCMTSVSRFSGYMTTFTSLEEIQSRSQLWERVLEVSHTLQVQSDPTFRPLPQNPSLTGNSRRLSPTPNHGLRLLSSLLRTISTCYPSISRLLPSTQHIPTRREQPRLPHPSRRRLLRRSTHPPRRCDDRSQRPPSLQRSVLLLRLQSSRRRHIRARHPIPPPPK